MKQTFFTLLLLSAIGLTSCRKSGNDLDIQQYDQQQIQNYIAANGITGMVPDSASHDSSGIYYKIIIPGSGPKLDDTNKIAFVFSLRSFDGKYVSVDTLYNQYDGYIGHITTDALPYGLQYAILNDLKHDGGSMRVLIPSRLAYGLNGYGVGSVNNAGRIAGNQCLDYYVHLITTAYRSAYDDLVIQHYMTQNGLTGYTRDQSTVLPGSYYYYKLNQPGIGTDTINQNSTITATYTGILLDNVNFDITYNGTDTGSFQIPNQPLGIQEVLSHTTAGAHVSMLFPSLMGYGEAGTSGVPANSCLRYEYYVYTVSP